MSEQEIKALKEKIKEMEKAVSGNDTYMLDNLIMAQCIL